MSLKQNWTICQYELDFLYSHDSRQKKRMIWMRFFEENAKGQEGAAASASTMTRSIRMDFSRFGGGSSKENC